MYTIEQWAKENEININTIKIVEGKKCHWLEWVEEIGTLEIKKRRRIHKDRYNMDWWIIDIINGQERYCYITYYNFDGIKKYNFFNHEVNKELHTQETKEFLDAIEEELDERGDL